MSEEHEYPPIAATRVTPCPHCPEDIEVGDAIARRPQDPASCHFACAIEQDEIDADPEGWANEQRAQWEGKQQAWIQESIVRVEPSHAARQRPRKRKRRRSTA